MTAIRLATILCSCSLLPFVLGACGDSDSGERAGPQPTATTAPTPAPEDDAPSPPPATDDEPAIAAVSVAGGTTTLRLSPTAGSVLSAVGVELRPIAPARQTDAGAVRLPIEPGRFSPASSGGKLRHTGGIEFTAAGRSLRATDLALAPDQGAVTAEVEGRRVKLFAVRGADPETTKDVLRYDELDARLGAGIADELEKQLGGRAPVPDGLPIGRLQVRADLDG